MTYYANLTNPMLLDFEALSPEAIDLSSEAIDEAAQLSLNIPNEERQWQAYLNALALFAFEQWLEQRTSELVIKQENCSILQPALANVIEAVCNLNVNKFKLCLIATGSLTDEEVTLPRAVVDLPEFVPHFYVLVEVQEEQETAKIQGFLSHKQLVKQQARARLQAEEDWTYQVPMAWFENDPDQLLHNLRCLEPSAIPLPAVPSDRSIQLSQIRSELEVGLPQLQSAERQLWEILTWEQGAAVLTSPELLNWLYQVQQQPTQQPKASLQSHLADVLQLLTQPAVNVGRWLSDGLDDLAKELSWVLLPMPSLVPVQCRRSPKEEFEAIVTELHQNGIEISPQARGAYRDLSLAGLPLRLYALTWPLLSGTVPEWTLLLILGAPSQMRLPAGLTLRVSDQTGILVERAVEENDNYSNFFTSAIGTPYFFTSVIGSWEEKFIVTVSLAPGIKQTLPPFSFDVERSL